MKKLPRFILFALCGFIIGSLATFSKGSLFILISVLLLSLFIYRFGAEDKKFLLVLFLAGFTFRAVILFGVSSYMAATDKIQFFQNMPGWTSDISGDSAYYTLRSWWIAKDWLGHKLSDEALNEAFTRDYGFSAHLYILAFFYYVFGFSPISSKLINCLLGVLSGFFIYFAVKEAFSKKAANLSAVMVVFFPSIFLWSINNLKDIYLIFALTLMIWAFVKFQKTKKLYYLLPLLGAIILHGMRRDMFLYIAFSIVVVSYFFTSHLSLVKKTAVIIIVLILIGLITNMGFLDLKSNFNKALLLIVSFHRGMISTGGSCYRLLSEEQYVNPNASLTSFDYMKMLFKGLGHFFFEPFPWNIHTKMMLISYPQMVLWYILTPFVIIGMLTAVRYRWRYSFILILYLFVIASIIAVTGGNIGTLLRHRDLITPILLIFCALGLLKTTGKLNLTQHSENINK